MTILELFEVTFKFILAAASVTAWFYAGITFILFVFLIGTVWGRMWNRDWSLGRQGGSLVIVVVFALLAAFAAFNLGGISKAENWMKGQRSSLSRSVVESGRFTRSVLLTAWDKLVASGGQDGLTPPVEGGNEIRLNSPEDAFVLAATAAEETRPALRLKAPFVFGIPIELRPAEEVANETLNTIRFDDSLYPTIASASNEWVTTAATLQINHAVDAAVTSYVPGMVKIKTISLILLLVSIIIPTILIPVSALADIKINPKV